MKKANSLNRSVDKEVVKNLFMMSIPKKDYSQQHKKLFSTKVSY